MRTEIANLEILAHELEMGKTTDVLAERVIRSGEKVAELGETLLSAPILPSDLPPAA